MATTRNRYRPAKPRKRRRLHRARVGFERVILGVMMTVVAWVVERQLLKVLKTGNANKRAMQKAERDARRAQPSDDGGRDARVTASPDEIDIDV
jgi:chemotaxis regulatin CheY-phosphate phosphatase CheZ